MSKYTVKNKNFNIKKYHNRRLELIVLLGGKCAWCGSTEHLEFDHKDPNAKEFSVSRILTYSWERILKEIKKCQLLCHECHLIKNKIDNGEAKHGSLSMYRYYRCRCILCVITWREKCRIWRKTYKSKLRNGALV